MLKQLLIPLIGVAAFIVVVGLLMQGKVKLGNPIPIPKPATLKIASKEIIIRIADNDKKRAEGLSGVTSLGENEGMFFVFESKDVTPSFWMKGMLIPLDIIWINDGHIVKIDKDVPISDPKKLYTPDTPIDYVLEVNAGFSDKNNLKLGDAVEGDSIKN